MKKKGTTFIEIVVAITIFLIAILPITYLTLNSLRIMKRSSEIEEGARVATSVINYIKSRGYDNLLSNPLTDSSGTKLSNFSGSYYLSYDDTEGAYVVVDKDTGNIITTTGEDFENDFYGSSSNTNSTSPDALFFIESLGIELEGAVIDVVMEKADLFLAQQASPSGVYQSLSYTNPVSASSSTVIFGSGGIVTDEIIYGLVRVNYTSKSTTDSDKAEKQYEQPFVVTPLENF